jgi:cell volume regulation protein A
MIQGVLLGAVIGGTSSAIVIAIESATLSVGQLVNTMLGSFTIAIFVGAFTAFSWIIISHRFLLNKYNYMLTLALVFGLYSITEAVNANGGISVFVFGIVLGNAKHLIGLLRMRIEKPVDPKIKVFQDEVTFFVRTFFFVYIGLLLTPEHFTGLVVLVSVALLGLLIIARWLTTRIVLPDLPSFDMKIVMSMMPRGLAAAVLATFPLASGLVIQDFQQLVFAIILLTNIAATAGIFIFRERPEKEEVRLKHTLEDAEKEEAEAKKKRAKAKEELKKIEKEEKSESGKIKKEEKRGAKKDD